MGVCASVEKETKSVNKLQQSLSSKNVNLVNPSPIILDRPISGRDFKSQWTPTQSVTAFRDLGSKEDVFFESQPWLESDCEDDFFSVKGDFTPSRGNTPVHHSFSKGGSGTPRLNILSSPFNMKLTSDSSSKPSPSPSPTDRKKKMLLELFRESIGGDQDLYDILQKTKTDEENAVGGGTPQAVKASPLSSGKMTPIRPEKRIPVKSGQCCFPRISPGGGAKKTSPIATMG
ncbi:uncharacterized protein LOC124915261 [Impatiens glandulifera]|uniref:uncharacterized protein LOC124915261 n=1 Tax=Impatiens glandulifera TaxID=253017 RepID=UPI001FB0CEFE|nr:uncharacterized protein LOC124915261 [Impatiens glandulifera]